MLASGLVPTHSDVTSSPVDPSCRMVTPACWGKVIRGLAFD